MKKAIVLAMAAVLALPLAGCGGTSSSSGSGADSSGTASSATASVSAAQQADSSATESGTIDAKKFKQIKEGMTYKQVVKLIGSKGEEQSTSSYGGITASTYVWQSDGWGSAVIMFENKKVVSKAQYGVGESTDVTITKAAYKKIKTGMSYQDVVKVVGGEGELTGSSKVAGYTTKTYTWYGSDLGSNATVTFQNDKVQSKAQVGL